MSYYSMVYYTGNGSLVNFTIPFPYLAQSHVKVYVQGLLKTLSVHYTFNSSSVIQFSSAPLENEVVTIKRSSGRDTRLVDYQTGSILDEATLDQDSNQLFYLMQEAFDSLTLAGNEDGGVFITPESILHSITGLVDVEHLVDSLNSPIGYWSQIHEHDAIYEFNEDGTSVYDHGVMGDEEARITLAESRITVNETGIALNVIDAAANTAQLALMANEFYVKLDGNGNVTGFGLYNGETSAFVVNADTFAVVKSDGTGDTITPFVVDGVSGLVSIAGNLLVTGSITGTKIGADEIEATHIKATTITAAEIVLGTIVNNLLMDGTIEGTKITEDAIDTPHLAANSVEAAQIKAGVVDTDHLAALSISTALLQVGSVDDTIIEDGAVTTQKINAGAVTATEMTITNLADIANMQLGASGYIRTTGKDSYTDNTAGLWVGYDSPYYKLFLGNASHSIKWTGTAVDVNGDIIATGNVKADNITVTQSSYTEVYSSLTTSYVNVKDATIINSEQNVVLWVSGIGYHSGVDPEIIYIQIKRGSTPIWTGEFGLGGTGNATKIPIALSMTDEPSTGEITYYVYAKASTTGLRLHNKSIVLTEYKR